MKGLVVTADCTRTNVVSHEDHHLRPIELVMDVLDRLSNAKVASQAVVVTGVKDIQLGVLVVGDIQ